MRVYKAIRCMHNIYLGLTVLFIFYIQVYTYYYVLYVLETFTSI